MKRHIPLERQTLTERQKRERRFYDRYAAYFNPAAKEVDFAPVEGRERRPWNSYWYLYQKAAEDFKPGARLLDFGSGPGENALRFSRLGFEVCGFDISETNARLANELFSGRGAKGEFVVSGAESLPYPDESFDVVAGIDILHHVDIPASLRECRRVLKKGGKAYFREPVESAFWDWLRNTRPVLAFAPKSASLENHITEDERKLTEADEEVLKEVFPNSRRKHFCVFSRFDKLFRKGSDPAPSFLERVDMALTGLFPGAAGMAGAAVYELEK